MHGIQEHAGSKNGVQDMYSLSLPADVMKYLGAHKFNECWETSSWQDNSTWVSKNANYIKEGQRVGGGVFPAPGFGADQTGSTLEIQLE